MKTKMLGADLRSVRKAGWLAEVVAAGLLVTVLGACGATAEGDEPSFAGEGADDADWGTAQRDITGGRTTTSFKSVVKILQSGSPCTACKLMGTNKFLTAAHCIINPLATSLTMIPNADGSSGQVTLSIPSGGFQIHPSFLLRNGSNSLDVYDIAVVTTTTATPDIVGLQLPSNELPPPVPSTATALGYGCDANDSTHNGKRQSGSFDLTGGTLDHCLTSSGPAVVCAGDSGGPLISNADGTILGVFDAGPLAGLSVWSRTGNARRWIIDPKPGNDPALFQSTGDLFFMHNKKVGSLPSGLCMVANSNVQAPPSPVSVLLDKCSDPLGRSQGNPQAGPSFPLLPPGVSSSPIAPPASV